jgi:hypothetical protein
MIFIRRWFAAVALILLFGCGKPDSVPAEGSSGPILKVAVFADGRVTLNGKVSSVNELKKAFIEAKKNNGVV